MKAVEFYQKAGYIRVEFCKRDYSIEEFLTLPDAKVIVNDMYHKIITEYADHIKGQIKNPDSKGEVLGYFIKKYFLQKDKTFDVVVFGNGGVMNFNLEDKNKPVVE